MKILAFAGSLRKDSINKKLTKWACKELKNSGVEVTFIDLADYPLPIYNQDITATNFPKEADALALLNKEHDILLISSPEHNGSISSCLKNAIDWISRSPNNEHNTKAFFNKTIAIMSTSPSSFGGVRSTKHLKEIFSGMGCTVIEPQVNIPNGFSAFDKNDDLISQEHKTAIKAILQQLVNN